MSLNESYPQHVVTAVIVAHDGAAWLPQVADALLDQTRPVQRIVAVDTGSRDRSGAVLATKFGQMAVFGMDRATGYGAAIARALAHRAANLPVPGSPGLSSADRVEWLWLLHDDCEPASDALEQLLRGAAETGAAAVLGPKLRDWSNREVVLEAGVTLDTAARRVTGIEPREVDQGQHDGDRDALAVCSAGMLVRRDVWDQVGGFDASMSLFMEDIDFCWRVHSAGYRVRVITDAICYHVQAATKRRRPVSVGRRARMLDRRNGLLTLLGNLPARQMLTSAAGNLVVSFLRITFFLLAKRIAAALDEMAAVAAVLGHPIRFIRVRSRRSRGRRAAYTRIRADLPPGRSMRRLAEFAATTMLKSAQTDTTGAHHASADPTDDDSLLVDNGLARRLLSSPALLLFVALLAVAIVAGRSLIGGGPLGGGSLVPIWGGASDLWHTYLQAFHPDGIGSAAAAPPYLAVIAGLATLLGGKPWLAIDLILLGCVPLSGMTALLAVSKITKSALVRVWAAASYALLPVAMGVVAAARFGTAVAFILLPLIVLLAGRVCTQSGQRAGRAAWATGLLVAIGAAFVPLLWLLTFIACCVAAVCLRPTSVGPLRNLAIVVLTAPILLLPWTLTLVAHPAQLLLEAGLPQPGTPATGLPAKSLVLLSPGGPGLPPYWVTAGLLAAAVASLFAGRRRGLIITGWSVALAGLIAAIAVSRLTVAPADGAPVTAWAGLPLAVAAIGLLLAAAAGADALGGTKGRRALSGRGAWAALIAVVACSAPLLAAASWLSTGVTGPVHPVASPLVPEAVAAATGRSYQVRTLVLRSVDGQISYLLLRGPSPALADAALIPPSDARQALAKAVSDLITPGGGLARNQGQVLAEFDIGYVLLQQPVDQRLASVLNNVDGLQPYNNTSGYYLWQLTRQPARVTVIEPNGTMVPIPSGPVGVSGAVVPAAGGTLLLAEPTGGWSATVNGQSLQPVPSPAGSWAQAFKLPAGGGSLDISHSGLGHDVLLVLQLLAFLALVGLALPGIHVAEQEGQHAAATADARRAAGASRARPVPGRGAADDHDDVGEDAAYERQDGDDAELDRSGPRRRADPAGAPAGRAGRSSRASGRKRRVVQPGKASRGRAGDVRPGDVRAEDDGAGRAGAGRSGAGRAGAGRAGRGVRGGAVRGGAGRSGAAHSGAAHGGTGRGSTGRTRIGRGQAAGDDVAAGGAAGAGPAPTSPASTSTAASGPQALPGRRPPGRRGSTADQRPTRPTGAWPYADADDRDDDRSPGSSGGPQARAWPYLDGDDRGTDATRGPSTTGPGQWPYPDSDNALGGDRRVEAVGRSPSGRSPSGSVPPNAWSEPASRRADSAGYERPEFEAGARDRTRDDGGRNRAESDPGHDRGAATGGRTDSGRAGRDRASRTDMPVPSPVSWHEPGDDSTGPGWSGLRPGSGLERRQPSPASAQRRSAFERAGWRLGAGRGSRSSAGEPASPRGSDPASGLAPYERPGRPAVGSRDDTEYDDQRRGSWDAGRPGDDRAQGSGRADRWGRREPDERYDEPDWREPGAGRATGAYQDWPGADESGLDPLPPPGAQARPAGRRRNVWRPDPGNAEARYDRQRSDDSTGDWDRLGPDSGRDLGRRWSESEPE